MPQVYTTPLRRETGIVVCDSASDARLITGVDREVLILMGSSARYDQAMKTFTWDSTSTASEGANVIKATATTTGRWRTS